MNATFKLVNPGEMEAELTLRLPLKQWEELATQLGTQWPSNDLCWAIREVVRKARTAFGADERQP